jgi:hypothetical protein
LHWFKKSFASQGISRQENLDADDEKTARHKELSPRQPNKFPRCAESAKHVRM